ncbi:hypothetical protein FI667_g10700, partial [Globisporangium splendens]
MMLPSLTLTAAQEGKCRETADELLDTTVREYDELLQPQPHQQQQVSPCQPQEQRRKLRLSRKIWKRVKTRENLTVFKERNPIPLRHCAAVGPDWVDPKLLVTSGTILGDLDDVMYGHVAFDGASMLLKAHITKNSLIGGATLATVEGPDLKHPFRFLGVKWFAVGPPTSLTAVVWPRDMLVVEATGITHNTRGERIGYQLLKSMQLPGYDALEDQNQKYSFTRGRVCSCLLFRQQSDGIVEVFQKGYFEAFGKITDSLALSTCARGFLGAWNAVGCSHFKKIMWQARHGDPIGRQTNTGDKCACRTCSRRFGAFSSADTCILCDAMVCSRCRLQWKLLDVDRTELSLTETDSILCKSCFTTTSRLDPLEIARQEIRSGRFDELLRPSDRAHSQHNHVVVKLWSFKGKGDASMGDASRTTCCSPPAETVRPRKRLHPLSYIKCSSEDLTKVNAALSSSLSEMNLDGRTAEALDDDAFKCKAPSEPEEGLKDNSDEDSDFCLEDTVVQYESLACASFGARGNKHESDLSERLWKQMLALQVANESIYQLTIRTRETYLNRDGDSTATTSI